ncbi:MAG: hypothetical protein CO137_03800 [Candidatus Magasanikbacteria bacterium CG_4_9_14_3_um_filter_32_9]|uniref:Schlafen AlbA-2 domain-containing protein n=1 Tax=Candidatus Magasanikbacteria bacterium CG_4_9_14_3_um_filter_32_9 TaxID=1974644 RepID=A0A2M7Z621_9BACT|nr:MAG: hypothetical protein CO137_03800 [Candidatus Magasanikbacteria bacterium CG_4_9_14_3_um_filter_32_9]
MGELFTTTVKYYRLAINEFLPYLENIVNEELTKETKEEIKDLINDYKDIAKKIDRFNLNLEDPNKFYDNEPYDIPLNELGLNDEVIKDLSALVLRMLNIWKSKKEKLEKKNYLTESNKITYYKLKNLIWPLEACFNNEQTLFFKHRENDVFIFPGESNSSHKKINLTTKEMIDSGEDNFIELKSSLRWDYSLNEVNKKLEYAIVKSISSFLNSEGGSLIIGVDDKGIIVGIENDYKTFKNGNFDVFSLKLINNINNFLGKENHQFIDIKKETIEERQICLINISKANNPVYLNNNGNEEFFIRASASSQPLSMKEAHIYIKSHWVI